MNFLKYFDFNIDQGERLALVRVYLLKYTCTYTSMGQCPLILYVKTYRPNKTANKIQQILNNRLKFNE